MVTAKKYIVHQHFDGFPKAKDLQIVEEKLPPIKDGEFLAQAIYLSVDPYMRLYNPIVAIGNVMIGSQVAKVLESKTEEFPVGKHVVAFFGWRTHTVYNVITKQPIADLPIEPYVLPDFEDLSLSLGLGILGMLGNTAYFGFFEICQPKRGDVVVVSGAGGAVGSIVGQIAKIKGSTVIGITGNNEKGRWIVDELGFDHFVNYKTDNVANKLTELAPQGINCYFDNVGGDISAAVISQMNDFGRISACGSISTYNSKLGDIPKSPTLQKFFVQKQLKMEGFDVRRWSDRFLEGTRQNLEWINEGKLKYRETVTEGFENMFVAFTSMLRGGNFGKAIVKV